MPDETNITPEILRQLLTYCPDTGTLTWKRRARDTHPNDTGRRIFNAQFPGKEALSATNSEGYRHGRIFGKLYKSHRVAFAIYYGAWPENQIDHIDGDKANNRIENLRDVTYPENGRNAVMRASNKSGHTGVHWDKSTQKWRARIVVDNRHICLGFFEDINEAAAARREANERYGFTKRHGLESCL